MTDFDVAVIGYGPAGMTLAALLGQHGHRVVVLERYKGLYNLPRAAVFDDETMRTFQKLGLTDALADGIVAQDAYDWVNADGEILVRLEYDAMAPGGWAALYMMYQPHIEAVLDRHDKALSSVTVRQGFTVSGLDQDEDGVTVSGVSADGRRESLRARFVVGADGGGSFVRQAIGGKVDDYGFQENWLVCDFHMKRAVEDLPMFRQVCDPAQPISIVRIGPHHHRFSFMLEPDERPETATEPARVWARVGAYLGPDDAELIRAVNYVFRSRIVDRWRRGRVFLAGDAAHEMPPFLGQGMCSGIRDGHNLAWKLDLVLTGRANEALLDTYQVEREPHVRFITEKAIELGRIQTLRDPVKARQRDERFLALRRAHQSPDKVRLPGLTGGLVADAGAYFPQGRVRSGERAGLFDDVVGPGWCIVAADPGVLDGLTQAHRDGWESIGGRVATFVRSETGPGLRDEDGCYAAWFAHHRCSVAVVRPDWYLYGTAEGGEHLCGLLDRLASTLAAPDQVAPCSAARPFDVQLDGSTLAPV